MVTIRQTLLGFSWFRVTRVALLIVLFFVFFDIVLAKTQYAVVPREGRRNPADSSAFVQFCLEELPRKAKHRRIFFFGDSTVQGSGRISQEDTVPAQLEKVLRKSPEWEDVEVYNFGMVGGMPTDLLTAILLFSDFESTATVIDVNHRKYGYSDLWPPLMNYQNLLANFTEEELRDNTPLDKVFHARSVTRRVQERISLSIRRAWFFYRFRGIWRAYFHSQDFKKRWRTRKRKELTAWKSGQVKLERFITIKDDYERIAINVKDPNSPGAVSFKRLFEVAKKKGITLKIYLTPFDFKFISQELKVPETSGREAIRKLNSLLPELIGAMPEGWELKDYTNALDSQVNFIDQEHLVAAGCRRLAEKIAKDFFGVAETESKQ
ncbi:MAG: hypothetical protein ACYS8W_07425 [Planctomycetota bacterium]|jgi:hypothetical protein